MCTDHHTKYLMNLYTIFDTHQGKGITKWHHYFPVYEKHFSSWVNKPTTFLEIGVFHGGSLQMWRRYFGPLATIIGIDINPECKAHEENGVHVRIGDQSDPVFLQQIIDEFGIPDVVIDDGSHNALHQRATFEFLYPLMPKMGCYVVEDVHTAFFPEDYGFNGGVSNPNSFANYSKKLIDDLNADHTVGAIAPTDFTKYTWCMSFYDSMIVFDRGTIPRKGMVYSGTKPKE